MSRLTRLLGALALLFLMACTALPTTPASARVELVRYEAVTIETLVQGSGPAIVILPSLGRDSYEDYDPVAAALAASGFKVLRPQPRGIGQSTGPMKGQDLYDFARDVAAVIDQHAGGRAVIVGHAYGHFVARMTAVQHPEKVRGVVLAAASAKDTGQRFPAVWTSAGRAGNLSLPVELRLEALRGNFFAPGNDPSIWLKGWHTAKSSGDFSKVASWYAPDFFTGNGKTMADWTPTLRSEVEKLGGKEILLKDVSYLRWTDTTDTMVVTFAELVQGAKIGRTKRQYWSRNGSQWKIFYEGNV